MSESKRYFQIVYVNEKGEAEYDCLFETTMHRLSFTTENMLFVYLYLGKPSNLSTYEEEDSDWFILGLPLHRVIKINVIERKE